MKPRDAGFARSSLVLLVGALALLGGLAWWLLHGNGSGNGTPRLVAPAPTPVQTTPAAVEATAIAPNRELAPTLPVTTPTVADQLDARPAPETFTRELSGLHGRLVEADGQPVANLKVDLLHLEIDLVMASFEGGFSDPPKHFREPIVATTTSNADGTFELRNVESTALMVLGVDLGGGRGTAQLVDVSFQRGQSVDLGDVVLPPHVVFTGTLLDEDGAPVADARIRVLPQLPWPIPPQALQVGVQDIRSDCAALIAVDPIRTVMAMPPPLRFLVDRLPLPTTTTRADGTFRVAGVPAGIVTLLADHPGHLGLVRAGLPTGRRAEQDVGTLRLSYGRTISGVVSTGDVPLAGARLLIGANLPVAELIGMGSGSCAIGQPTAPTDATGHFELRGLPENGDLLCALQRQAGDPWELHGPFPDGAPIEIKLPPATTLAIAIQDGHSKPVSGAELRFVEVSPANQLPFLFKPSELKGRVSETEPGRYVARELPVGEWQVIARAPGYGIASSKVTLTADGATTVITLGGAASLPVHVIDAAGAPVDYALVSALGSFQGEFVLPFTAARTDVEGRALLQALPVEAPVVVRVSHPGYARGYAKLGVEALATAATIEVVLLRGGDLVGRVQTQGAPPEKPLMLFLTRSNRFDTDNVIPDAQTPHFGMTKADGTFAVHHLPAGKWRYAVMSRFLANGPLDLVKRLAADNEPEPLAEGETEILEGQQTTLEIEALPDVPMAPATLHGEVRVGGERVAKAQVQLSGRRWNNMECDERGAFAFADLRPGRYTITIHRQTERGRTLVHTESLVLQPGEDREVRVDARLVPYPVVVQLGDGSPAAQSMVTTYSLAGGGETTGVDFGGDGMVTDENGAATLELLPSRYALIASHQENGRCNVTIDASRPPDRPLVVTLNPGIRIAGHVVIDGWQPDPSVDKETLQLYLSAIDDGQFSRAGMDRWMQLDPEKLTFEAKGVDVGKFRAMLWMQGEGGMRQIEFEVPPGGATDLVLHFEKG